MFLFETTKEMIFCFLIKWNYISQIKKIFCWKLFVGVFFGAGTGEPYVKHIFKSGTLSAVNNNISDKRLYIV